MQHYETVEDRNFPGTWRVEHVDDRSEGEVSTAIFIGPNAEARARDYATLQSRKSRAAAPPKPRPVRKRHIYWSQAVRRELPELKTIHVHAIARYFRDQLGLSVPLRLQLKKRLRRMNDSQLREIRNLGRVGYIALKAALGG